MKKSVPINPVFVVVLTLLLAGMLLVGCGQATDTTTDNLIFTATIESVQDNSIVVTTADDVGFDKASVQFDAETEMPVQLFVGQTIEIEALPDIRESHPVQITAVKLSLLEEQQKAEYKKITATEAEEMMDEDVIILDVRTESEFEEGHIPKAVLLSNSEIALRAEEVLPDKEQVILVYCRSGNRSAQAAKELIDLGYTNVYDFGGIVDWQGGIVQ